MRGARFDPTEALRRAEFILPQNSIRQCHDLVAGGNLSDTV